MVVILQSMTIERMSNVDDELMIGTEDKPRIPYTKVRQHLQDLY
jgi:hypothetical protein